MDPKFAMELAQEGREQDYLNALEYIKGKIEGKPMQEIAERLGCSRSTLYEWVKRWEDLGLLIRIRQELLLPQLEDIRQAIDEVMKDWPKIIARVKGIALTSESDHVSLEAAEWLYSRIVKPTIEEKPSASIKELNYVQSNQGFDPTVIPDAAIQIIVEAPAPKIIEGKAWK